MNLSGEEMGKARTTSRFGFVNRMNDKFDERSARALRESLEYSAQKQAEREERRLSRKQKSKRQNRGK